MVGGLVDVAALDLGCGADLRFSLEYVRVDGTRRREPLAACAAERFEEAVPARSFHWAKGAAHFPGSWWSSTTLAHVGFESWLERDHVMLMDFDPGITGIASQPFWLYWQDGDGRLLGGMRRISSRGGPMGSAWWWMCARMTGFPRRTLRCSG